MAEAVVIPTEDKGPTLEEQAAAQEAAAAAAKAEEPKLAGEDETSEDRPEWLPEKFKTVEDMAKAYGELEKAQGKPTEEPVVEPKEGEEAAAKAVDDAGLDMDALSAEYAEKGELTAESLEALAKVGISKDMVDSYIAGQEAQANALRAQLLEPVGGEEAYGEMISWASDNLSDAEIDAFNDVLAGGEPNAVKMAVENLNTKYTDATGSEPTRQLTGKGGGGGVAVYESTADLMKDMQNPEYAKNPAFRAKVEAKLARSSIL
jgi:hypothetical protein